MKVERLGILGCRIDFYNTQQIWFNGGIIDYCRGAGYHCHKHAAQVFDSDFITGCLMLIPTSVLLESGLFDERFFLNWEDIDLSCRIKKIGYRLIVDPSIVIDHKVSRSIGSRYTVRYQYYFHRNRMIFFEKHLIGPAKFLFYILQFSIMIPCWLFWQILCARFDIIGAAVKGYLDFFKGMSGFSNI